ncbi:DNA glycosylase AlkZ-like family protein [Brevibacterium casei]
MHRQHLLTSAPLPPQELIQHLVGLQAQNPWSWYSGFFRRTEDVTPEAVSQRLGDRSLVRMSAMRATIHLMTPQDAASLRFHTQIVHQRTLRSSFGRDLKDVNLDDVTVYAQALLEERWGVTLLVDSRYQEGTTGNHVYESQDVHAGVQSRRGPVGGAGAPADRAGRA